MVLEQVPQVHALKTVSIMVLEQVPQVHAFKTVRCMDHTILDSTKILQKAHGMQIDNASAPLSILKLDSDAESNSTECTMAVDAKITNTLDSKVQKSTAKLPETLTVTILEAQKGDVQLAVPSMVDKEEEGLLPVENNNSRILECYATTAPLVNLRTKKAKTNHVAAITLECMHTRKAV
jgi:hypothetical protein